MKGIDWFHYTPSPDLVLDRSRTYVSARADKPHGFWISPVTDGWRAWRESASWGIPDTEYVYRVTFAPNANLLTLTAGDVWDLHHQFPRGRMDEVMPFYPHYERHPSWETIMERYDGVLIPEYHWQCRMEVDWYHGWDCASGCIWNLNAIADVTLADVLARPAEEMAA